MKINDSKNLGYIIKQRREKLGYTQKYVSDFTGLSISFISDIENGKETAQIAKVLKLIQVLSLDLCIEER